MQATAPTVSAERIQIVDVLRGFALLGILLMNIVEFGMYHGAYDDPTVTGGSTGANLWVWISMHILAEGKMRALFSMLFGAGVVLLTSRLERRAGLESADIYFRRNFWLLLMGIAHAFLLWQGEILYPYALCGLLLYPCRGMKAKTLLWIAASLIVGAALLNWNDGRELRTTFAIADRAKVAEANGQKLTDEQEKAKKKHTEILERSRPTPEALEKDAKRWRGSFMDVLKVRAEVVMPWHSLPYYSHRMWDLWSMMLLGIAFLKMGILTGQKPSGFYWKLAIAGYLIGFSINSTTAWLIVKSNFDLLARTEPGLFYDAGRLAVAMAHMAALILIWKSGAMQWLTSRLAATGQMALSNYIMHSLICSTIFCGYGFAMYGRLERVQLYYIVGAIWVLQMILSPIWLEHFRFGPMEWVWRSLTYWQRQPMRKSLESVAAPATAEA